MVLKMIFAKIVLLSYEVARWSSFHVTIWSHLIHSEPTAHIKGFRNLFDYLNTEPMADDLRQLVVNYFNEYPHLQSHLHLPLSRLLFHLIL